MKSNTARLINYSRIVVLPKKQHERAINIVSAFNWEICRDILEKKYVYTEQLALANSEVVLITPLRPDGAGNTKRVKDYSTQIELKLFSFEKCSFFEL